MLHQHGDIVQAKQLLSRFQAGWAEGRAVTMEQAIAYALPDSKDELNDATFRIAAQSKTPIVLKSEL